MAKCEQVTDHVFRFDEETPMDKGVYLILTCENCGQVAEGLVKYKKAKPWRGGGSEVGEALRV